ncbi:TonB family protein [Xiashengella succiniciproducens]|uniref:TonB family protein n=1 Tax=Xiashengella succiniciproducens TaxID=2949635 RepID=A0A9J6ZNI7_9BACT|nr:TonB family protein [Alkaliflexus sp. Ai-910]URW79249.1 TonB family protein [Alkaliflexus sp. Ai-910]
MDERPSDKSLGVFGTIVFHLLLLLALIFISISSVDPGDEGILVALGDSPTGQGQFTPSSSAPAAQTSTPPASQPASTPPPTPSASTPARQQVLTQNTEEAPAISAQEKARQEEQKRIAEQERQRQAEIERQRKAEQERQRQEELERQRIAELERQKREQQAQQAAAVRNTVSGALSNSGSNSQSEGDTGGSGTQGALTGDPNVTNRTGTGQGSEGVDYSHSLKGRTADGEWPRPEYPIEEQGKVVVNVTVDKNGNVIRAEATPYGSTFQNKELWRAAERAAFKAKFNKAPEAAAEQHGSITYHFNLK